MLGLGLQINKGGAKSIYGPEIVNNGTFDADSGWIKGPSWSIGSGVASYSAVASIQSMEDSVGDGVVSGETYRLKFTIAVGTARLLFNKGGSLFESPYNSTANYAIGTHELEVVAARTGDFRFFAYNDNGGQAFTIDNISLKKKL